MPEDTPLETTAGAAAALADAALHDDAVTSVQSYAGTASPYTFNGLVRHYFLRRAAESRRSAGDARRQGRAQRRRATRSPSASATRLDPIAARLGARIQVVEVPPGPPVLQTLVAEVYGPDPERRLELARTVRTTFEHTPASSTWTGTSNRRSRKWQLEVDDEKAAAAGRLERRCRRRRPDGRRRRAGGSAARCQPRAKTCRSSCGCRARSADRSTRCAAIRIGPARRSPSAS